MTPRYEYLGIESKNKKELTKKIMSRILDRISIDYEIEKGDNHPITKFFDKNYDLKLENLEKRDPSFYQEVCQLVKKYILIKYKNLVIDEKEEWWLNLRGTADPIFIFSFLHSLDRLIENNEFNKPLQLKAYDLVEKIREKYIKEKTVPREDKKFKKEVFKVLDLVERGKLKFFYHKTRPKTEAEKFYREEHQKLNRSGFSKYGLNDLFRWDLSVIFKKGSKKYPELEKPYFVDDKKFKESGLVLIPLKVQ